LVQYLAVKYPRRNVEVWINSKFYLGLWVWGFCLHTPWGSSRSDFMRARTEGVTTINLAYVPKGV